MTAAATVVVCGLLIAMIIVRGSGGVRDEGMATTASTGVTPTPSLADTMWEAVRVVKFDPKVAKDIRDNLLSCGGRSSYPVDDSYGHLTTNTKADLVVNVETCTDDVGIGSYVYRWHDGKYENVFADEEPPVSAQISDGMLKVTHQIYGPQDTVSNPSGEDVTTYAWDGKSFIKIAAFHHEYTAAGKKTHG
jgi:hypothetical protein